MDFTFDGVTISGGFFAEMQKKNREVTVPAVYDRFYETGRVEALACRWKDGEPKRPHIFWDSDIAKWLESAAYVLAKHPDPDLESKAEEIIDLISENQWEDGYINSFYTSVTPESRFTDRTCHELYCAGHLIEAAVAHRPVLRWYSPPLLLVSIYGSAGLTLAAYGLWALSPATAAKFGTRGMALTIPFVLFGLARYVRLLGRGLGGRPEKVFTRDLPLLLDLLLYAATCAGVWLLSR